MKHQVIPKSIKLRPMTIQDIPFGLKLSQAAGWNQTEADWILLLEQSTAGSFIACFNGMDAGTVTTISYQQKFHWVGMVLVEEKFQRHGIGQQLLEAAIQAVHGQGAVYLDATPAGKKLYDSLGFQDVYNLARWLRKPAPLGQRPASKCFPLTDEILLEILQYDFPVFGADRAKVLESFQRRAPQLAFYSEQNGRLSGYCMGRVGRIYTQIGPVIADSFEIAQDLLLSALDHCTHQQVIVDTTYHHPGWNQLLCDLSFVEQRPFTRMRLGDFNFPEQHHHQFAIAGPELG